MKEDKIHEDIDLLERYLAEQLPDAEKKEVEGRLLSDPDFINLHKTLTNLPNAARKSHLQGSLERLREIEKQLKEGEGDRGEEISGRTPFTTSDEAFGEGPRAGAEDVDDGDTDTDEASLDQHSEASLDQLSEGKIRKIKPRRWWWMGIAASVVVLVGVVIMMRDTRTEGEKLFIENFEVYPMVDLVRGETIESDDFLSQAYQAYSEGHFKEAYKYFRKTPNRFDPNFYLYYSCTLVKVGKMKEARGILDEMMIRWPEDTRGIFYRNKILQK